MGTRLWMAAALVASLVLGGVGCAGARVTPEDKDLMWQNEQGAILIEETAVKPEVKAVAADIKENAATLRKSYGDPEKKVPYSPEASAAARKASTESHAQSWIVGVGLTLLGIAMPVVVNRFAPGLGTLASNLLGGVLKSKATRLNEANSAGMEQYLRAHPDVTKGLESYVARAQKQLGVDSLASKVLGHVKSNVLPQLPASAPAPVPGSTVTAPVASSAPSAPGGPPAAPKV